MPSTSVRSCLAFVLKCCNEEILFYEIIKKWVWKGVWPQEVWPMMIVTTLGSNFEILI